MKNVTGRLRLAFRTRFKSTGRSERRYMTREVNQDSYKRHGIDPEATKTSSHRFFSRCTGLGLAEIFLTIQPNLASRDMAGVQGDYVDMVVQRSNVRFRIPFRD